MGKAQLNNHTDIGCQLSPSCLNCELPECASVVGIQRAKRARASVEIKQLRIKGMTLKEVSMTTGKSVTSIQKILKEIGEK